MRVFLAGATGHVGGAILDRLLEEGHEVSALCRGAATLAGRKGVTPVPGDIGSRDWAGALEGHAAVINAVGLIRARGTNTFERVVVEGTRNLVEACRDHGVPRFVQVSANGIDSARVPYQTTKLAAEAIVKASGLRWTILRPSVVYGPRDDFTNRFASLMRLGVVPYFGHGRYSLAPVADLDVAAAVTTCLSTKAAEGRTFHLCGPERIEFRRLLKEIKAASGRRALIVRAPKWAGYALAAVFGRMEWFPADLDALKMLFAGNTCAEEDWKRVLGIQPRPFGPGVRAYLGQKAARA